MDLRILAGLAFSALMIGCAVFFGGSSVTLFDLPAFFIVIGGTFGAAITQFPCLLVIRVIRISFTSLSNRLPLRSEVVENMTNFAILARRDGILSLEPHMQRMQPSFMKKGLQLAIDGLDPDTIEIILSSEMENTGIRHGTGAQVLEAMATYAPALGMMGTVIGLVQMLNTMNDPSQIGPAMALALITTLYGIVLANLLLLPLAGKLRLRAQEEALLMEMMLEGILGLAKGENPHILRERLIAFQPPHERAGGLVWQEPAS